MCFSDTRRGPNVLSAIRKKPHRAPFWCQKSIWGPLLVSEKHIGLFLVSEKHIGPPSGVNMDPFGAWGRVQTLRNHGMWRFLCLE